MEGVPTKILGGATLNKNDGDGKENGEKSNTLILAKQQLCTSFTLFCTFLSRRWTIATRNFLISRSRFIEKVNTTQKFYFSFSKLSQKISPTFGKLNETE